MKPTLLRRGYVAIVSVLIICSILVLLAFTESTSAFWSRFQESAVLYKTRSFILAESCAYEALTSYMEDSPSVNLVVGKPIFIYSENKTPADDFCSIDSVTTDAQTHAVHIQTHADIAGVYSKLYVTATISNFSGSISVTSWREDTDIPP